MTWHILNEYEGHPRGTELTFRDHGGINRRARFIEFVTNTALDTDNQWLTVVEIDSKGVPKGGIRSIHPHMVLRWWRKQRTQATRKQRLKQRKKT